MSLELEAYVKDYKIFLDVRQIFNTNYKDFCLKVAPLLHCNGCKIYTSALCAQEA
ncbi:hypothetical protein NHP190012_11490 [Helicobacter sp. NHP19-012]|uniref:Uncharacterized protein n=1 Tax=Helicobacter gastrofelis TaxID=2849642 RepID=A0ABM7SHV1_9HELI|nr:hypothetical protein [Helicobacter sp. NHP19-012]BCZ19507.1 hypothetical protein NHP190012_11490 [Helicobacter sp. NHP19-012]